jgi:hypothetical protein
MNCLEKLSYHDYVVEVEKNLDKDCEVPSELKIKMNKIEGLREES